MPKDSKIVIIGSGVFGISAAYHLAKEQYQNIKVFDKGDYDNNKFNPLQGATGASTDFNKLVRASYVEKVHYQNLALESLAVYYEWNKQLKSAAFLPEGLTNDDLIFKNTGYVRLDDYPNNEEERTLANFSKQGLRAYEYDINDPEDIERSKITGWYSKIDPLNQKGTVKTLSGVLDSIAGVANADKALLWMKYLCERTGNVDFIYGPRAGSVSKIVYSSETPEKVVGIETADGKYYPADYVIVAAGGWTPQLLPSKNQERLESVGSTFICVQIPHDRQDLLEKYKNFPMVNWKLTFEGNLRKDGVYMFPATDDGIIKIGANDHFWRYLTGNDKGILSVPNTDFKLLPLESLNTYKKFFRQWLGDLSNAGVKIEKSRYRFSAVGQHNEFVIDFIPGHSNLIVSSGGGFHGFKFLPIIGRFVEGLISGKDYKYAEFFKFDSIPKKDYDIELVKDQANPYALNSVKFVDRKTDYFDL
ncbi:hypothetical protein FOA43_003196 [Brettanomyces nanus]|uniref:FAD dependent oxidoreductase domain-containing protein n=1 Tax=Eeniella nana TaxID=13502 RepID=A0A875S9Y7_EENNA|nr:uncharacterized protein FOA43_003196 [Brettanomyces nanus]QPG75834.1 hypothetical protein FOA43_003196 [Brettanomyces nanus]